jgi:hypothetical protein
MSKAIEHPYSEYAKWHLLYLGYQFFNNGKPVPKFVAWFLIKHGRDKHLTFDEKPGWHDGALIDKQKATEYYNEIQY